MNQSPRRRVRGHKTNSPWGSIWRAPCRPAPGSETERISTGMRRKKAMSFTPSRPDDPRPRPRETHQKRADEAAGEHGEEDAADEPEESEGIELVRLGRRAVRRRLLVGQLAAQLHGVVEAGQVLLEAAARRAVAVAIVPRRPLPSRPLADLPDTQRLAAGVRLRRARPLRRGAAGPAAGRRGLRQEGGRRGGRARLGPVQVQVEPWLRGTQERRG